MVKTFLRFQSNISTNLRILQSFDEKLDALLLGTNYLVFKSAQHDRELISLKKAK